MVLSREYLATYTYLASEIRRIDRRLKYYELHPLNEVRGIVKGSMNQFPYAECHFTVSGIGSKTNKERKNIIKQICIDLENNKQMLEDMKMEIELFLECLPPEKLEIKHILALRYVDGLSYEDIGELLGYHSSTICIKIEKFLCQECMDNGSK